MKIVWDEIKRQATLAERGLDFADAEAFEWEGADHNPTKPAGDGRPRFKAVGWLGGNLLTIVYSTLGAEAVQIISMRRASRKERRQYNEQQT